MNFHPSPLFLLLSHLSILASLPSVSCLCVEPQRSALLSFFSDLSSLPSWTPNRDCCLWEGVKCDNATGQVIALDVSNRHISGPINSSSFASLNGLLSLNLSYNNFNSYIPFNLSLLSNLTHLNLSNSGFAGQIPADIARLNKLVALDISTSFLKSPLTSLKLENPSIGSLLRNLSRLTKLHLDGVKISSAVPKFLSNFTDLACLRLSSCSLLGEFPAEIFLLPKLETLDASLNPLLLGFLPDFRGESALRTLLLSTTKFSGRLPPSFGNLSYLTRVELSNCNFSGEIPASVRSIRRIVHLKLRLNRFTGLIPSLEGLTELQHLDLSFNNFSGPIPSLDSLTRLVVLDLSHNVFGGRIPLLHSLKAITEIVLASNNLTGEIPESSGDGLHNLTVLDLGYNSLHGLIPSYLFTLPSLQNLVLSRNHLDGQLIEFGTAASSLQTIDLSYNNLQGQIPSSVFGYKRLKVLDLSSNMFNGSFDLIMLQNMKNLTWLDLSDNKLLVNSATAENTSFPQLRRLYLGSCRLNQFPYLLRNQWRMTEVDLSNNIIDGEIPNWVWSVGSGNLRYLNLSHNFLRSLQQPHNLSSSSLSILDLHSNQLQGEIPLPPISVVVLDYSKNNFTSTMSSDFATLLGAGGALFFSISGNNVSGEIPSTVCSEESYLQVLDLSDNHFSGSIPNCVVDLNLDVLNLRNNHLTGTIPSISIEKCALRTLNINGNQLEGKIPESLSKCGELEVLDFGNNRLSGAFPYFLNTLSKLRVLVLRSNRFSSSLCQHCNFSFPMLQIMDLSSNRFGGILPAHFFMSLNAMMSAEDDEDSGVPQPQQFIKYHVLFDFYYQDSVIVASKGLELKLLKILTMFKSVDLSNNRFEGEIPTEIGALSFLRVLNFSNNLLMGQIPVSIENLRLLESLDLSENQLSGRIPPQLTQLTFLSVLNLSYNQLVGSIPSGRQFNTFETDSFIGNPQLCGMPLSRKCSLEPADEARPASGTEAEESSEGGFDWELIFAGLGFGGGLGLTVGPLLFWRKGRRWHERLVDKVVVMIFPPRMCDYLHCEHPRVEAEEQMDEDISETETDSEKEEEERHSFCVFCTRIDARWEKVIHKDCSCHEFFVAALNVQSSS